MIDQGDNLPDVEDWQVDIDDDGASIGVCPKCGSEARIRTSMLFWWWQCQNEECKHKGAQGRP